MISLYVILNFKLRCTCLRCSTWSWCRRSSSAFHSRAGPCISGTCHLGMQKKNKQLAQKGHFVTQQGLTYVHDSQTFNIDIFAVMWLSAIVILLDAVLPQMVLGNSKDYLPHHRCHKPSKPLQWVLQQRSSLHIRVVRMVRALVLIGWALRRTHMVLWGSWQKHSYSSLVYRSLRWARMGLQRPWRHSGDSSGLHLRQKDKENFLELVLYWFVNSVKTCPVVLCKSAACVLHSLDPLSEKIHPWPPDRSAEIVRLISRESRPPRCTAADSVFIQWRISDRLTSCKQQGDG